MTANVMSLFGFIIVTGIVVDDAIVTAENIYCKISDGIDPLKAAIQGTKEIATPVTFGALTTVVAFLPMMFFDGNWGDYARQVPTDRNDGAFVFARRIQIDLTGTLETFAIQAAKGMVFSIPSRHRQTTATLH